MFDRQRVVRTKTGSVKKDWKGTSFPVMENAPGANARTYSSTGTPHAKSIDRYNPVKGGGP